MLSERWGMLSRGWVLSITKCMITPLPRPVNRITDACENITLPKTSFASGKKDGFTKCIVVIARNLSVEFSRNTQN